MYSVAHVLRQSRIRALIDDPLYASIPARLFQQLRLEQGRKVSSIP